MFPHFVPYGSDTYCCPMLSVSSIHHHSQNNTQLKFTTDFCGNWHRLLNTSVESWELTPLRKSHKRVSPHCWTIHELLWKFWCHVMVKKTDFTSFLCDWCTGTDRNGRPWMADGRRRIVGGEWMEGWSIDEKVFYGKLVILRGIKLGYKNRNQPT